MPNEPKSALSPGKTVAWYGVIFTVDLVIQMAILIGATILAVSPGAGREEVSLALAAMARNGRVFLATAFASAGIVISAVGLVSRRQNGSAFQYLAIRRESARDSALWLSAGALFCFAQVGVFSLVEVPSTNFWQTIVVSNWLKPFLFLAIVLVAPAAEEIMYRGFLFRGLVNSRLGAPGAIMLTALAWASVHMQYNLYEKASIFVMGLIIGTLRYRRNSLTLPFCMHVGVNLVGATLIFAGF